MPHVLFGSIAGSLAPGVVITLELTAAATVFVLVVSVLLALGRNSIRRPIVTFSRSYVDIFRSVPLLAMVYLIFFGLAGISRTLSLSAFWAATVAITISEGAYTAEIYSSAIRTIRRGQWDAAESIGLTRTQTLWRVILPQAIIPAVAPTVNMMIWVIKDTSLASLITVNELTLHADELININAEPFKTYLVLLGFYVVVTVPLGYLGRFAERRLGSALGAAARLA